MTGVGEITRFCSIEEVEVLLFSSEMADDEALSSVSRMADDDICRGSVSSNDISNDETGADLVSSGYGRP